MFSKVILIGNFTEKLIDQLIYAFRGISYMNHMINQFFMLLSFYNPSFKSLKRHI